MNPLTPLSPFTRSGLLRRAPSYLWPTIAKQWVTEIGYFLWFILCIPLGVVYRLPPVSTGVKRPVVLVPGFMGKGLEFFRLRRTLLQASYPVYVVPLGSQIGDIHQKRSRLKAYLQHHQLYDCYVLGYSMGGWVALGLNPTEANIRKLITVGVSFQGTWMAYTLPFFRASWQLMPRSKFMVSERKNLKQLAPHLTNVMALADEITVPLSTCHLKGCTQVPADLHGHLNLVMSEQGIQTLLGLLEEDNQN